MLTPKNVKILLLLLTVAMLPCNLYAAPDQYPGDTSIYGGTGTISQPNVLLIIDTSGSMADSVYASPYDPGTTYPVSYGYTTSAVYKTNYSTTYISNVSSVTTSCGGVNPQNLLLTTGQYHGRKLNSSGTCARSGTATYYLGNYDNWLLSPQSQQIAKIDVAKNVVTNLVQSTNGVNFGLMRYRSDSNGGQFMSASVSGANYITTIKNMNDIFTGTTTNRDALIAAVNTLDANGMTPLAETLFEAMRYYTGGQTAFANTIGVTNGYYTSPVQTSCQKNYVVFVTDGMSTADNNSVLKTICNNGDCDGDGIEPNDLSHSLDDVAKYLYTVTLPHSNDQHVNTYTVGFGLGGADANAVALLSRTADNNHGNGQALLAQGATGLSQALSTIISNILEINSSFVAPVVPVSPENRTTSASRMYIGLFKPTGTAFWDGNLKKFGLDTNNNLIDKTGAYANYVDLDGNGTDDRYPYATLPPGKINGSFRDSSTSYWSSTSDSSDVNTGGAGELLETRDPATRNIYTYFTNPTILDASNAFVTTNTTITPALLGVTDTTAKNNLIGFVRGTDTYDDNLNGNVTENRDWIMGDVLHSKPAVVNYLKYSLADESTCTKNKTMIYVGSNDGMLHAFKDCDGSEAWAFIPPDALPNLQYLHGSIHTNFVDSTVIPYVYDNLTNNLNNSSNELNIVSGTDKVLLLVGQRRGGGTNAVPAKGNYYLLDATDPFNPLYLMRFSNLTAGFTELGETWSEPTLIKIKVNSTYKIAAVFAGGYDNLNEDSRYGATQSYLGTGGVINADSGAGSVTSTGTTIANTPKGRGIYIVEIATLTGTNNTTFDFTNAGSLIWSYTNATNPTDMKYSIAGEIATVDTKGRGYIDRLYAVDTAGSLWRFNIGAYYKSTTVDASWSDSATSNWKGLKVFTPNPGSLGTTDVGRKAFYKPAVVLDYCYDPVLGTTGTCDMVFYGTGDREHPLNTDVTDRMYMVKVKDQDTSGKTECSTTVETQSPVPTSMSGCLLNVTSDQLQTTTTAPGTGANPAVGSVPYILNQLKYSGGWYIKLDENEGEKVLSSPRVINKVAYYTTYVPTNTDPCQAANPGDSYVYELNYLTGEAAQNLNTSNDAANSTTNTRGQASGSTTVLARVDRKSMIGQGISSGVVSVTSSTGVTSVVASSGGNIVSVPTKKGQSTKILYWRQK